MDVTMKRLLLIPITVLFISISAFAETEEGCVAGGGTWATATISQGDDPDSNRRNLPPFCQCDTGFYWNDSLKSCEDDQELRCGQTGGAWANNECQCPEGTIKWTEGFGCDMPGPEPKANADTELLSNLETEPTLENKSVSYESLLLISIFILLFVIGVIIYFYLTKSKNRRKEDEVK